jgi:hypothetical protein
MDKSTQNSKTWLVKVAQDVTIAPRRRHMVTVKLDLEKRKEIPPQFCIGPAAIPIQGILTARAISRVGTVARDTTRPTTQPTQAKILYDEYTLSFYWKLQSIAITLLNLNS